MDAEILQKKIDNLLREVHTVQAFSTRVEKMLQELRGGVGTAQRAQNRKEKLKEELRLEIRKKFNRPYNKKQ